jgi:hypothetical protein
MPRVTEEQVRSAKALDLLSYMRLYEPGNLMKKGNDYCTKEHDSLIISENGLWHWTSRNIGGKTALQYLIKVKNMDFVSAVLFLCNDTPAQFTETDTPSEKKTGKKPFALPEAYHNNDMVIGYLKRRGIFESVIAYCISKGLIYESGDYHNAVFVGFDGSTPKYAALRGTWKHMSNPFKGEVEGSNKRFSFSVKPEVATGKLVVSESAVDALSVATIRGDIGRVHYLSIGGAYTPKKHTDEVKLPMALEQYLSDQPEIKKVELCLDNDAVGIGASFFIMNKLIGMGYEVTSTPPERGKDWNEFLVRFSSAIDAGRGR